MKLRVFGFTFDKNQLPPAMLAPEIFDLMQRTPGTYYGKRFQCGTKKLTVKGKDGNEEWWGGIILKVRDAKTFTKLAEVNGNLTITAETLADNEKLAEINFFVAHSATGSGLFTHHYQAASLGNFRWLCARIFDDERKARIKTIAANKDLKPIERKRQTKELKGRLWLSQLCQEEGFKALIKKLKSVKSFEVQLTTVKTRERLFRGISERAVSETVCFNFPTDVDVDALSDAISNVVDTEDVGDAWVSGTSPSTGKTERVKLEENFLVFGEMDYDESMNLQLDLSDWGKSIESSALIDSLIKFTRAKTTHQLLTVT
jgi:hypothetical protein